MPLTAPGIPRRHGFFVAAGMIFALGVVAGATMRPLFPAIASAPVEAALAAASAAPPSGLPRTDLPIARRLDPELIYPAEVVRIIDGDTFEARVRVWPGLDVDTHVRLRGIDAARYRGAAPTNSPRRKRHARRCRTYLTRAASRWRASASTNTAAGSTPWWRHAAPPMFQRRCFVAAGRAPTTAASADRGAGSFRKSAIKSRTSEQNV